MSENETDGEHGGEGREHAVEQAKIDRINELARKAKEGALTEAETAERAALRREYVDAVTGNLRVQLENTYVVNEHGTRRRLRKKGE